MDEYKANDDQAFKKNLVSGDSIRSMIIWQVFQLQILQLEEGTKLHQVSISSS